MRKVLMTVGGLIALAVGLLWVGQGTGYVQWPRTSFMIGQSNWIYWGAGLAVLGLLILWRARR